ATTPSSPCPHLPLPAAIRPATLKITTYHWSINFEEPLCHRHVSVSSRHKALSAGVIGHRNQAWCSLSCHQQEVITSCVLPCKWASCVRLRRSSPSFSGGRASGRARPFPESRQIAMTFTEYSVRLLRTLIRAGHLLEFEELPTLLAQYADAAGLRRPCVFVIDLQENVLREVTGRGPDAGEGGQELHVDSTVAGRVFRKTRSLSLPASGLTRHWLPILDSTERLGVFRVDTEPDPDQRMLELIQDVASIIGMILIS